MNFKSLTCVAATGLAGLLAGCVVLSVYPFYTAKDLIFDPGLAGRWGKNGETNECWQFVAAGDRAYVAATVDSTSTNNFDAHLFRLAQQQFLDLRTTNRQDFQLPLHLLTKVTRTGSDLKLSFMDYGWLAKYLETNPGAVRHIVVLEKPDDTNSSKMVYLTADTQALQKFLRQHAADTNAFNTADELKRLPE